MDKKKYAILILAAGESKRLGRPKQMVVLNNSTLLNNTIEEAIRIKKADVFVILGDKHKIIQDTLNEHIPTFINPKWKLGMGASIAFGVKQIKENGYDAIILSVCDQPYISEKIFNQLISSFESRSKSIFVSKYNSESGPPTLFDIKYADALEELKNDQGAKEILRQNLDQVGYIEFKMGEIDIDTELDITKLKK